MSKKGEKKFRYDTGLVLSGGGARGYAHLGVIKALEENNIDIDVVAGASAGAIAGVLFADGYNAEEILEIMSDHSTFDMISLTLPKEGLFKIKGINKLLDENLKAKKFEDLKKPLYVAVTNLNTGKVEYFHGGEIKKIIVASSSIPVIFAPVKIGDYHYVDGGVMDNAPVAAIRDDCKKVIGSVVNHTGRIDEFGSLISIAERTLQLSLSKGLAEKLDLFDVLIRPSGVRHFTTFDQSKAKELFDLGYKEAVKVLRKEKKG